MNDEVESPLVQELHEAVKVGDIEKLKSLIEEKGVDVNSMATVYYRVKEQMTPLHRACGQSHTEVARYLISKGASLEMRTSRTKATPLLYACMNGREVQVRFLIMEAGADVCAADAERNTVLHYLIRKLDDWYDLVLHVLKQSEISVESTNDHGTTLLHEACNQQHSSVPSWNRQQAIISLLLERCPELLETKDSDGKTPLIVSEEKDMFHMSKLLVTTYGANPDATDIENKTPLQQHSCRYQFDHLRELVEELGANPLVGREKEEAPLDHLLKNMPGFHHFDAELINLRKKICFLVSQYNLLSPKMARLLWTLAARVQEQRPFDRVDDPQERRMLRVEAWKIRMHWVMHHCCNELGISPEETQKYPVHSIFQCIPYLRFDRACVIDWNDTFSYCGKEKIRARNSSGVVPLQLYLSQQVKQYQQRLQNISRMSHFFPPPAVVMDCRVLHVLLAVDRRLLPMMRNHLVGGKRKRQSMPAFDSTATIINPFTTPIRVDGGGGDIVDRAQLDVLYRLVRVKPEALREALKISPSNGTQPKSFCFSKVVGKATIPT